MQRFASRFLLSAWVGFFGVSAIKLAIDGGFFVLPPDTVAALAPYLPAAEPSALAPGEAVVLAALFLAVAGAFFAAIVRLGAPSLVMSLDGERLAGAALASAFTLYAAATLTASPVAALFGSGAGFCIALAATLGTMLFDHAVTADDSDGDRAFHEAMARIEAEEKRARAQRNFEHLDKD